MYNTNMIPAACVTPWTFRLGRYILTIL